MTGWETFKQQAIKQARLGTFEGAIEELEALCERYANAYPNAYPTDRHSDAWHAERILWAIRSTRDLLARGEPTYAAAEALAIGSLAARWPQARVWRRRREQAQEAGRKGGSIKSATADALEEQVEDLAVRIRERRPYHKARSSQRWLARRIAGDLGEPEGTVRGHLRRLGIR